MAITGGMLGAAHTTTSADDFFQNCGVMVSTDILKEEQFSRI